MVKAQADRRKLQLGAGTGGAHAHRVKHQVGDLEHFRAHLATLATDQGTQARFQFLDRERLGQVIVGAKAQAGELVVQRVAGRQHQHRGGLACVVAQAATHFDAVQAWQHEIQHDHVVAVLRGKTIAVQAVLRVVDLEATAFQVLADHFGDIAVVFDDQHEAGRFLGLTHGLSSVFSFVKHAGSTVERA